MEQEIRTVRISVVMTTYNAGPHLTGQLESLLRQTRQPEEVLIFDDCSSDNTVQRLEDFICRNGLSAWRVYRNNRRKNWKKNFWDGMSQASGDLIFPCDQDDVWHEDKLERMERAMEQDPRILVLACDYHPIYEPGALPLKIYRKTPREKAGLIAPYGFTKHFFMNPNPGCSFAVRKSFFEEIRGYWKPGFVYDEFLWLMAVLRDGARFYNRELLDYYRYAGNASGVRYKDIPLQLENLDYIAAGLEQFELYAEEHPGQIREEYRQHVRTAQIWCGKRRELMHTRDPFRWLAMAPLWGYYNSPRNCLSDLWLVIFGKFRRS